MNFVELSMKGSYLITPEVREDDRGWFGRTYCKNEFASIGHRTEWVQMNHSSTKKAGTIRGMHYQIPPFSEIKLIRCIRGAVYDVIIDLREGSPTFLKWEGIELSEENRRSIYIPEGFAHGFQSLLDDSDLIYHHSAIYASQYERGIRYDDPMIGIQWPREAGKISERDRQHPSLEKDFNGIKLDS